MKHKAIKTILFDLGNVILPLAEDKMYCAFEALGGIDVVKQFKSSKGKELYKQFEHLMPVEEFRKQLRDLLQLPAKVKDAEIDKAWTAILLPIPSKRLEQILALKKMGYEILLLSNSNEIHLVHLQALYGEKFKQIFTHQYYSHEIKRAKPDKDAFTYAIGNRDPQTVIFFDDKSDNVDAAKNQAGLHAVQFTMNREVSEIPGEINTANARLKEKAHQQKIGSYVKLGLFGAVAAGALVMATKIGLKSFAK